MPDTWVIVAESSRARILKLDGLKSPLRELDTLVNPEGRAHERELISDRQGRTFDSTGRTRHAKQPAVTHKEQRCSDFARKLADRMERARVDGRYDDLIVIAAPEFLGLLRSHLTPATRQLIKREIHKNVVREDEGAIRNYLKL